MSGLGAGLWGAGNAILTKCQLLQPLLIKNHQDEAAGHGILARVAVGRRNVIVGSAHGTSANAEQIRKYTGKDTFVIWTTGTSSCLEENSIQVSSNSFGNQTLCSTSKYIDAPQLVEAKVDHGFASITVSDTPLVRAVVAV